MGKKNDEQQCLNIVLNHQPFFSYGKEIQKLLKNEIRQDEKPDFIINSIEEDSVDVNIISQHTTRKIGIEHFLTDVIFEKKDNANETTKAMSIERQTNTKLNAIRNQYKNNEDALVEFIKLGKAALFSEEVLTRILRGINNFSCYEYIENFKRIYLKHYNNRHIYKEKCDTLGFLIEIPYPPFPNLNGYIIKNNSRCYSQSVKTIPFTKELFNFISIYNDVDFVILCVRPLFPCGSDKKTQIVYINPKNCNIVGQNIVLCDSFDYPIKYINENQIKLSY